MIWILIGILTFILVYYKIVKPLQYWSDRRVVQESKHTVIRSVIQTIFRLISFNDRIIELYNTSSNVRYIGTYQFNKPTLLLRDPELIKQIAVKDFDHFHDHGNFLPEDADDLWSKNLFSLRGEKWRDMRATLSPAFTSSKMRNMFCLISECAHRFTNYFVKQGTETITVEMKDTFTRFTNDVIATIAFGIECDSLGNKTNEFYMMGKKATDFSSFRKNMSMICYAFCPKVAKFFGLKLFETDVSNFFIKLVTETIATREAHDIVRPDMLNILMEARKGRLKHEVESNGIQDSGFATVEESDVGKVEKSKKAEITYIDITAQALIFFFAGFESAATLLCFTAYELALNPDIQKKLQQEIDNILMECNGKLTYEALLKMKYLDMVISETLRKWPPSSVVDRVCVKPYTIQSNEPNEVPIHLKKGDYVWIPIIGLLRDPNYYPEPEKYDPERFSEENKSRINPYSYLPFGVGPRNCIASRFALLEAKTLFFHFLSKFELVVVDKTDIPLQLSKKSFVPTAKNGFWLGCKARKID